MTGRPLSFLTLLALGYALTYEDRLRPLVLVNR
jgi:hypothetical protein